MVIKPGLITLLSMAANLDICVPVYNESVRELLHSLRSQQKELPNTEIAIYLIDDGSPDTELRRDNKSAATEFKAVYIQQTENAGRSKTRNAFLNATSAPWLLFLDGDSLPARNSFLEVYLSHLKDKPEASILYGGTQYPSSVDNNHRLHHAYATDREALAVEMRQKHPVSSFHANNFVIHRDLLEMHPFEERLTHYGHEDSLLAIRLAQAGIAIHHLDNPVQHMGLIENSTFLQRTQQAVRHLPHIHQCLPPRILRRYSSLWRWYERCRWFWPKMLAASWAEGWMSRRESEMREGIYHSRRFALYKLLYLLQLDPLSKMHSR